MSDGNGLSAGNEAAEVNETAVVDTNENNRQSSDGDNQSSVNHFEAVTRDDNLAMVKHKNWKTIDDALQSYRDLESVVGKGIYKPADDASPEEIQSYYNKLGRPETADEYKFELDQSLPENFPYDEPSAIEFRAAAHENGLTQKQAQGLHDWFVGKQSTGLTEGATAHEAQIGKAHGDIVARWGSPDSPVYKENVTFADRAMREGGLFDSFSKAGMLGKDAMGNTYVADPAAAFFLAQVGREMFSEDQTSRRVDGGIDNPFANGDGENYTRQGMLIKNDPKRAVALIRSAGKDPKEYGFN